MKKIVLLATLLVAGGVYANTTSNTKESVKIENVKKQFITKKKIKKNSSKAILETECRAVIVTCTSAYTCQNWSEDQWNNWAYQIQSNYCMIDSPFTP